MKKSLPKRSAPSTASPLLPSTIELSGVFLTALIYIFAGPVLGTEATDTANILGPCLLSLSLAYGVARMAAQESMSILTPAFTFRVATLVYFGIGSLVPLFISSERLLYLQDLYLFSSEELAKFNLLVAVSVCIVLTIFWIMEFQRGNDDDTGERPRDKRYEKADAQRMLRLGLALTIIGSVIKYLFVIPVQLNWVADILPSVVVTGSSLGLMGIFLLAFWSLSFASRWFPAILLFVLFEAAVGVIILSKSAAILPVISLGLGALAQKATWRRAVIVVLAVAGFLEWAQPLVGFGRDQLYLRTGGTGAASISDRVDMLAQYYASAGGGTEQEFGASAMRITYVNAGTLAMKFYDNGRPGNSFDGWYYSLVPRILWPDKPTFQPGKEFARLATDHDAENSVAPGIFAEAYWNFGWWGPVFVMPVVAVLLILMSRYCLWVCRRRHWLYLPIAFLCTQVGLSADGWILGGIIGTMPIIVATHCVAFVLVDVLRRLGLEPGAAPVRMRMRKPAAIAGVRAR